jgi:hypothetical protein
LYKPDILFLDHTCFHGEGNCPYSLKVHVRGYSYFLTTHFLEKWLGKVAREWKRWIQRLWGLDLEVEDTRWHHLNVLASKVC